MDAQPDGSPPPSNMDEFRHPAKLENVTPGIVMEGLTALKLFLQTYGWFFLIGLIVAVYFKKRLQTYLTKTLQSRRRHGEAQDLHRYDSAIVLSRQEALESSRRRLQETHDAQAARFAEEQEQKQEEKRKQKIAEWDRHVEGKGYHSRYRPPDDSSASGSSSAGKNNKKKPTTTYRSADYNPLMGDASGSTSYRPPARRGGGG